MENYIGGEDTTYYTRKRRSYYTGVFAEEKPFTYLYTDDETGNIVLMEPNTYAQLDVPKHLFGDSYVFLQDDMRVCVQLYDERPMSASIPTRVTCTVAETPIQVKGASVTPQYKKAVLDNGVTVQVPGHILPGDKIIINTTDNSYMSNTTASSKASSKPRQNSINSKAPAPPTPKLLPQIVNLKNTQIFSGCGNGNPQPEIYPFPQFELVFSSNWKPVLVSAPVRNQNR
nr:elongation factor P-like [Ipomoea batatas]